MDPALLQVVGLEEHRLKSQGDPGTFGIVEACAAAAAPVAAEEPAPGILVLSWQVAAAGEVVVEVAEGADAESQEYWMDTGYAAGQDLSVAESRTGWGNLTPTMFVVAAVAAKADYVLVEWSQGNPAPSLAAAGHWDILMAGSGLSAPPARALSTWELRCWGNPGECLTGAGNSCGRHCCSLAGSRGGSWARWPACRRWETGCRAGRRAAKIEGNLDSNCPAASPVEDRPSAARTALRRRTSWGSLGIAVAAAAEEASHQVHPSYPAARNRPAFGGRPSRDACPGGSPRTAAAARPATRSIRQAPSSGGRCTGQGTRLGYLGCSDPLARQGRVLRRDLHWDHRWPLLAADRLAGPPVAAVVGFPAVGPQSCRSLRARRDPRGRRQRGR